MSTLKAFFEFVKPVLTLGVSINATCRQEIREVVGKLADELDRALSLADSYLVGVQFSKDEKERANYLISVRSKLMNSFLEHHICAGLYHLADEFKQVFNPKKLTVSISSFTEIPNLIKLLQDGERAVLDDLDEMQDDLAKLGQELSAAKAGSKSAIKDRISKTVEYHREKIANHRKLVKAHRRKIVDKL